MLRSAFEGLDDVAADPKDLHPQQPLVRLFQNLTRRWYAPIPVTAEATSRLAEAYTDLMRHLGTDADTEPLFTELQTPKDSGYNKDPLPTKMSSAVMAVLQLMENVFTEFRFENPLNMQNPRNEGWIATFRKCVRSPIVYDRTWPKVHDTYHRGFQEFIAHLREEDIAERDVL